MDTSNRFHVQVDGSGIVIRAPLSGHLSTEEAINLAAWLVALADPKQRRFEEVLGEVLQG